MKYLTKAEELHLGTLIQDMLKVRDNENKTEEDKQKISIGEKAVDKLVRANIGLVHERAIFFKNRYPSAPDVEDLIQDGMAGLMNAVYKFDPSRGNKFSTVAYHWIGQAIRRGTNKTGRLVRLPENRITDLSKISKIISEYDVSNLTQSEQDKIILEKTNLTKNELQNIRNASYTPASLNKPVSDEGGSEKELIDFVSDFNNQTSAEDTIMKNGMFEILQEFLDDLTNIEKDVLSSSFFIGSFVDNPMKPKEVREKYNISQLKFKKVLSKTLNTIHEKMDDLGINFSDFIE